MVQFKRLIWYRVVEYSKWSPKIKSFSRSHFIHLRLFDVSILNIWMVMLDVMDRLGERYDLLALFFNPYQIWEDYLILSEDGLEMKIWYEIGFIIR